MSFQDNDANNSNNLGDTWGNYDNFEEGVAMFLRAAGAFGGRVPAEVDVAAIVAARRVGPDAIVAEIDRAFEAALDLCIDEAMIALEDGVIQPEPIDVQVQGRKVTLTYGAGRSYAQLKVWTGLIYNACWVVEAGVYAEVDDYDGSAEASAQKRAKAGWGGGMGGWWGDQDSSRDQD
ncbi:MAG: hypothetical protein Q8R28_05430 [Dehalococcoidia bacterium]|nr:hypothetical protein [Dehalococcoidia bacterium]